MIFFNFKAPGTYRPEKVNLNKGPQYSLYGKGISEKPNNNPGEYFLFFFNIFYIDYYLIYYCFRLMSSYI